MEKLVWSDMLVLDNPNIDRAHDLLIKRLTQLADAPDAMLCDQLFALIREMEADFKQEEASMEASAYPDIREHREQHARVLNALHLAVPDALRGDFKQAHEVLDLLPSWLVMHINTMDRALSLYLAN